MAPRSPRLVILSPDRVHSEADDSLNQLRVAEPGLASRQREIFVSGEVRIRIRLDEIDIVVETQPQVDARVAVDGEQTVDAFASLLDLGDERRVEIVGELVLEAPTFPI